MDIQVGLRERKKAETRQAVHEAALRLTVEHGFDAVTVEAIADAANISRRTFSNYFAGKEDAVLYGEEERVRLLVARIRARPSAERPWQAMRAAIHDVYREVGAPDHEWAARTRLARKHPALLARQLANHAALERELAEAITERAAPGDAMIQPRLMAAAFLVTLRIGTHLWVEEQRTCPLHEVIDEYLTQMAQPFV
ncbi:TetR/AcrR family transcriptional regulator [Nonomuraea cavernae]|uniref:TetR family transcriptional regulator n=1 Tax=Nonomuraea cavernae TaxID=2045107 RepID=A0A917YZ87_9ACTN|nr:TetR family transcriptional regulator [Nonomuraea cavernae]MCA2187403.1 TetR/AcrR family transcriptional regulator [Nonomuraea cavernae]GGO68517.1 TetR family transcriptional regulator [Nonomuraea cavernae]